jgi:hypothetical protein
VLGLAAENTTHAKDRSRIHRSRLLRPMKPTANGTGSLYYRVAAGEDIEYVLSPKHERMPSR